MPWHPLKAKRESRRLNLCGRLDNGMDDPLSGFVSRFLGAGEKFEHCADSIENANRRRYVDRPPVHRSYLDLLRLYDL
ncbi:hypothetical protein PENARI_c066G06290 [Penicillium arizonense]|uniref:Uncharacterized protein n=1 Tax=Penicillium arizonense TaxID=1835702 RepID=A0A1F5L2E4_PENAI|nr:hypothetical protein PENARI_c066G06290 [Penicillium arizonense]OGE47091.1 hypothetical protein PENARI_c066G06290 [Penicillium arizonense]